MALFDYIIEGYIPRKIIKADPNVSIKVTCHDKNIIKDKIRWKDYRYIIKNRDELAQLLLKNNNYKYKILGNILKLL